MRLLTMPSFGFLSSVRIRKERASSLASFSKEEEDKFVTEIKKIVTESISYYLDKYVALLPYHK